MKIHQIRINFAVTEQVHMILETEKTTDINIITNLVSEKLKMPYLKENPLFSKTILAHCFNHGWK